MNAKLALGTLLVCAAVAVWSAGGASSGDPDPATRSRPRATRGADLADGHRHAGLHHAPDAARRLGIAGSNFIPEDWHGPEPVPEPELSWREREALRAWEEGALNGLGNGAVFFAGEGAAQSPPPTPSEPRR